MAFIHRAEHVVKTNPTESHQNRIPYFPSSALLSPHGMSVSQSKSTESNGDGFPRYMRSEDEKTGARSTDRGVQVGSFHFLKSMQMFKRMAKLHEQATSAQINARQKRRAAGFQRRDVWVCDAAFMKELQKLMAQDKLKGFEGAHKLIKLAEECQTVRNDLGPLEQDCTEAEQQLEGEIWKVQQAVETSYGDLEGELCSAEMYSSGPTSLSSSSYHSGTEDGKERACNSGNNSDEKIMDGQNLRNSIVSTSSFDLTGPPSLEIQKIFAPDTSQEESLLGVSNMYRFRGTTNLSDSDSAIGDIDMLYEKSIPGYLIRPSQPDQRDSPASLERYPELSTEIETTRERINKWLLNTTLLSHFEADVLRQQLDSHVNLTTSNWSHLVMAYWGLDEAATPSHEKSSEHMTRGAETPVRDLDRSGIASRGLFKYGIAQNELQIRDPVNLSIANEGHAIIPGFLP